MVRSTLRLLTLAVLGMSLSGCLVGRIYQDTVEPLTTDFRRNPDGDISGVSNIKQFQYSVVDIRWDSNAIGDIARENGIKTVYYADIRTMSIFGIWTQQWVTVYGK